MYREIRLTAPKPAFAGGVPGESLAPVRNMTFRAALVQIIIADVSMSLDNVLAVAGAAKGQIWVLAVGLTVAVAFMALLSAYIAKLLARFHWITWIGLAIVLYVAVEMVWTGTHQIGCQVVSKVDCDGGALRTLGVLLS
jgi:predicted tellurium resistance membrane protein TerC